LINKFSATVNCRTLTTRHITHPPAEAQNPKQKQQSRGAPRHGSNEQSEDRATRDAPGHMGLISENHPGMTAEIPAWSPAAPPAAAASAPAPAPGATASSAVSRALLAAASASITPESEEERRRERERRRARLGSAGGGGCWGGGARCRSRGALRLGLSFPRWMDARARASVAFRRVLRLAPARAV
jgi:hypothetical protein